MQGFSVASVVLSYFMVAGGMFAGMLAGGYAHVQSELMGYVVLGVGAFAGGYFAARASRGSTIVEPAIGGLAVIGTFVALVAGTDAGKMVWSTQEGEVVKVVAKLAASTGAGALVGAWIAEKFFGEAPTSSLPWFPFSAFATFGSCLMVTLIAAVLAANSKGDVDTLAKMMLVGLAAGCLVGGVAIGASARARPLLAAFLGGGVGVLGFCLLITRLSGSQADKDQTAGIAVLAVGGAIVTLIGWAAVGKKAAGSVAS